MIFECRNVINDELVLAKDAEYDKDYRCPGCNAPMRKVGATRHVDAYFVCKNGYSHESDCGRPEDNRIV